MSFYKNKWIIYIVVFFCNLIPAYAIERLFWQERGMNIKMVVYCEIIYAVTIIILEIPSGLLADKLGRKKLIVWSNFFEVVAFLVIVLANSFWHFALSVFISGIGTAFASGAYNALLYDSLVASNEKSKFEKVLGRINAIDFGATIIAGLFAGFLATRFGFLFNYYVSLISIIIAFLFTILLKEPPRSKKGEKSLTLSKITKTALEFFKTHVNVLIILVNAAVIGACINYVDEFWQLYLESFGFNVMYFGIVSAIIGIALVFGSLLSPYLLKVWKHKRIIFVSSFICGIGILFAVYTKGTIGIVGFAISCGSVAVINPIALGYMHHKADDSARATIESFVSLLEKAICIVIGLFFGYISTKYNVNIGFLLIGTLIIVVSTVLLIASYINERKVN